MFNIWDDMDFIRADRVQETSFGHTFVNVEVRGEQFSDRLVIYENGKPFVRVQLKNREVVGVWFEEEDIKPYEG